jgi:hypothetical protein
MQLCLSACWLLAAGWLQPGCRLLVVGCLVGYLVVRYTLFLAPCFLLLLFRLLDARCLLLWLAACLRLPRLFSFCTRPAYKLAFRFSPPAD